mmetsp:Transcript_27897/g.47429  ORF Transcript_27897/g.47429 Transcript_27897/m.47429 type:complete len:218 (+) Transcript_27897:285-938(+)|eukprot:CAMPEP_0183707292 /NCGR_PEP_ID=MMETSP0737-20130205/3903_1 /TAXON_ID=385413 /ORGANISM="Thalassiosira miniscula, Strain CCMP1093" /LENGTH=217 /DNA_ID=CAMNT_0025934913 /DNA_START=343 /DNA_END=996 /DNA_ORIENTATION=-
MPRILAPRTDSFYRKSSASPHGSRTSLKSVGSTNSTGISLSSIRYGSQLSLRRSSLQNGPDMHVQQNAVWCIEDQGSVSQGPPSLVSSRSSSRSSSQSSMQHYPGGQSPVNNTPLHRYHALRRASLQHPPISGESSRKNPVQGLSLQYPTILHPTNIRNGSPGNSFLPSAQIKEEDTWGHFVETGDADDELVRRSRLLSISRRNLATLSLSGHARTV